MLLLVGHEAFTSLRLRLAPYFQNGLFAAFLFSAMETSKKKDVMKGKISMHL